MQTEAMKILKQIKEVRRMQFAKDAHDARIVNAGKIEYTELDRLLDVLEKELAK